MNRILAQDIPSGVGMPVKWINKPNQIFTNESYFAMKYLISRLYAVKQGNQIRPLQMNQISISNNPWRVNMPLKEEIKSTLYKWIVFWHEISHKVLICRSTNKPNQSLFVFIPKQHISKAFNYTATFIALFGFKMHSLFIMQLKGQTFGLSTMVVNDNIDVVTQNVFNNLLSLTLHEV